MPVLVFFTLQDKHNTFLYLHLFVLAARQARKAFKKLSFYLFLQLKQINFIFSDNVHMYFVYKMYLLRDCTNIWIRLILWVFKTTLNNTYTKYFMTLIDVKPTIIQSRPQHFLRNLVPNICWIIFCHRNKCQVTTYTENLYYSLC